MAALRFIGTLNCQILTANRVALPPINLPPVPHCHHEYNQPLPLDLHDHAIVIDAVAPQAGEFAGQRLAA